MADPILVAEGATKAYADLVALAPLDLSRPARASSSRSSATTARASRPSCASPPACSTSPTATIAVAGAPAGTSERPRRGELPARRARALRRPVGARAPRLRRRPPRRRPRRATTSRRSSSASGLAAPRRRPARRSSAAACASAPRSRSAWSGPFELLLVDEPFVGLDLGGKEALLGIFDELHADGAAVVVATHDPVFVERVDRCVALRDGEVVHDGRATVDRGRPPRRRLIAQEVVDTYRSICLDRRMDLALKAIAEPRRRAILRLVRDDELASGEIARHFDVTGPAISQHLGVLKEAGLVRSDATGPAACTSPAARASTDLRRFLDDFWDDGLDRLRDAAERAQRAKETERCMTWCEEILIDAEPETIFPFLDRPRAARRVGRHRGRARPPARRHLPGADRGRAPGGRRVRRGRAEREGRLHVRVGAWRATRSRPGRPRSRSRSTPRAPRRACGSSHSGLPDEQAVTDHTEGWDHYLERLATVATGGTVGPDVARRRGPGRLAAAATACRRRGRRAGPPRGARRPPGRARRPPSGRPCRRWGRAASRWRCRPCRPRPRTCGR